MGVTLNSPLLSHWGAPVLLPSWGWSPRYESIFRLPVQQLPPSAIKHAQVSHPGKVCQCPHVPAEFPFPVSRSSLDTGPSKLSSSTPALPPC